MGKNHKKNLLQSEKFFLSSPALLRHNLFFAAVYCEPYSIFLRFYIIFYTQEKNALKK